VGGTRLDRPVRARDACDLWWRNEDGDGKADYRDVGCPQYTT